MKIRYSFYELTSKRPIQSKRTHVSRHGALLQVEFDDGSVGYADCHPWEELGDLPLQTQLDLLKNGRCTRLTARSIYFAKADAKARANKSNLIESRKIPMSHYLLTQLDDSALAEVENAWNQGFTIFKLKLGNELAREEQLLMEILKRWPKARLRLDFNGKLNEELLIAFLDRHSNLKHAFDYIEDPYPFNYATWRYAYETFHVPLAADEFFKAAYGHPEAAQVLVMKPAVQTLKPVDTAQRLVVTSYLDHPFGQMTAAYMASFASNEACGVLSHTVYENNPFAEQIEHKGPYLEAVPGYGFGFDELLKKLKFV